MKKRIVCLFLSICLVLTLAPAIAAAEVPTQAQVYERIIALQEDYPEGSYWGDDTTYECENNSYSSGGSGCVGFAYMVSENVFGTELPFRKITENISIENIRVGDILRNANDNHSVVVLEIHEEEGFILLVEGNYKDSVHWYREMSAEDVAASSYMLTRYPADYEDPTKPSEEPDATAPSEDPDTTDPSEDPDTTDPSDPPAEDDEPSFPDIDGHWAEDEIEFCIDLDLMNGMGNGMFEPEGTATRAQLVTILWRMCQEPEYTEESPFTDLTANWYHDAVCWAAEVGIVEGMTPTEFDPNREITREQLVTILYRFLTLYRGIKADEGADLSGFPDYNDVSNFSKEAVEWAYAEGIINGVSGLATEPLLLPRGNATRAQMAAILVRFIGME